MIRRTSRLLPLVAALMMMGLSACQNASAASDAQALPAPVLDAANSANPGEQTAVFAGGCFWGIEAVFEHVKGVQKAVAGYSGGARNTATYEQVSDGDTGHAESVKVQFDPKQVSYGTLLRVFFSVALDPTERNRQGPDSGTQYRSVVFYGSDEQQKVASSYIAQLTAAKAFDAPIVTQVVPLKAFYPAEAYHQHYFSQHPDSPYIVYNDAPKVAHLAQLFPKLYRDSQQVVEVQLH
jgi:peptide-methionine (S)-S-oxide reductase